jgi:hypothetical protein
MPQKEQAVSLMAPLLLLTPSPFRNFVEMC